MKTILGFLFLLPAVLGYSKAGYITFKPAYFHPQDKVCEKIYKGGFIPLGEVGFFCSKNISLSIESGYFKRKSTITSFDETSSTRLTMIPTSLFFGYSYPVKKRLDIYFKIGPNLLYEKTWVNISNLKPLVKKWSPGASFSIGTRFIILRHFFGEIFTDYYLNHKKIDDRGHIFLGGWIFGGGLGYYF